MERTLAGRLATRVGRRVRMAGWLHHQRQLAHLAFVLLRDRSGIAQVVLVDEEHRAAAAGLLAETVIEVEGTVVAI
jgi:nondiscriminating aspartyl-tRNA synthetase